MYGPVTPVHRLYTEGNLYTITFEGKLLNLQHSFNRKGLCLVPLMDAENHSPSFGFQPFFPWGGQGSLTLTLPSTWRNSPSWQNKRCPIIFWGWFASLKAYGFPVHWVSAWPWKDPLWLCLHVGVDYLHYLSIGHHTCSLKLYSEYWTSLEHLNMLE